MKGDFARVTFDPSRHYSQVLQQQGRVLLEADWNEQAQIQLHLLRSMIRDLVGPCWAAGGGFAVTSATTGADGSNKALPLTDWLLAPGHFYVDGIQCANQRACTLAAQPHAPTPDFGVSDGSSGFENPPRSLALWLDVWERHLCSVEAPDIADVALDGVDTATRAQVIWQVRMLDRSHSVEQLDPIVAALKLRLKAAADAAEVASIKQQLLDVTNLRNSLNGQGDTNETPCALLRQLLGARDSWALPRLRAELGPVEADNDPCVIAADARYRGVENQLYRVEIHQPGLAGAATFKWSRENGSVVFPITRSAAGSASADGSAQMIVTLARLGRDDRLGLAVNDWVELVDDAYTLGQRAFPLLRVMAIDVAASSVTLDIPKTITPWQPASDPHRHALLRRWDQSGGTDAAGTLPVSEGAVSMLEDGIEISFAPGGVYATGDYWLIPARVSGSGLLDWPQVVAADGSVAAAALPPRGLHHRAALGLTDDKGTWQECCCRFDSLCQLLQAGANRTTVGNAAGALQPLVPAPMDVAAATGKKKTARTTRTAKTTKPTS